MQTRVSVVITTYNRPELLPRAIESVLEQTFTDLECIVVDDCSPTLKAKEIIGSYDDDRLQYTRHTENQGLSAARNTGIDMAQGDYVAFLDDDDEWLPGKLEKQYELFQQLDDEYALVYCWMDYRRNGDSELLFEYQPTYRGNIFPHTLDRQPIGAGSTLLIRKPIAKLIQFDESLSRGIDGDFVRRLCREYKVDFVPDALVNYYVDHGRTRITRDDEEGIRNAIEGKQTKLHKFGDELSDYPAQKARIYSNLGKCYGQVGDNVNCVHYHIKAIKTHPWDITLYKNIFRTARQRVC
ncbi:MULTISPECIES: glycosyltransferase family 2 protein [Haloarcula]|uniref:glycosyltransferase family 2 protein n=1 Tax=Haloarcula TaxID=2237 RepID=UPI0023EB4CDC|nr:glycosyltransferase family 2 protein [Halomicroarcula sp. XH51]